MNRPQSTADLHFFDPRSAIACGKNRLPHWQQEGATVFLTFRLADSIPQVRLRLWQEERSAWLTRNPRPWSDAQDHDYHTRFSARFEAWCDEGAGSCAWGHASARSQVASALMHWDSSRHWQHAWVIMPNHVHALFSLIDSFKLPDLVRSWKGFTARTICPGREMPEEPTGFWMKDYFDRLVRDATHFWRCARYIRSNPERAKLTPDQFTLFEAPFVQQELDREDGICRDETIMEP